MYAITNEQRRQLLELLPMLGEKLRFDPSTAVQDKGRRARLLYHQILKAKKI